jgi:hypothetical protein
MQHKLSLYTLDIEAAQTTAIAAGLLAACQDYAGNGPRIKAELALLTRDIHKARFYEPYTISNPHTAHFAALFQQTYERSFVLFSESDSWREQAMTLAQLSEQEQEQRLLALIHDIIGDGQAQTLFGFDQREETDDEEVRFTALAAALLTTSADYPDNFSLTTSDLKLRTEEMIEDFTARKGAIITPISSGTMQRALFSSCYQRAYALLSERYILNTANMRDLIPVIKNTQPDDAGYPSSILYWIIDHLPAQDDLVLLIQEVLQETQNTQQPCRVTLPGPEEAQLLTASATSALFSAIMDIPTFKEGIALDFAAGRTYLSIKEGHKDRYPEEQFCNNEPLARKITVAQFIKTYQEVQQELLNRPDLVPIFQKRTKDIGAENLLIWCNNWVIDHWKESDGRIFHSGVITDPLYQSIYLQRKEDEYACNESLCLNSPYPVAKITLRHEAQKPLDYFIFSCKKHYPKIRALCDRQKITTTLTRIMREQHLHPETEVNILIYKDPSDMTANMKRSNEKLLIERFRIIQRPDEAESHDITKSFGKRGFRFVQTFHDAYVDLAKKFRFAPSSVHVAQYLPPMTLIQSMLFAYRYQHYVWIELEEPIDTPAGRMAALSYGVLSDRALSYAQERYPLGTQKYKAIRVLLLESPDTASQEAPAGLDIINLDGQVIWTMNYSIALDGSSISTLAMPDWVKVCDNEVCGGKEQYCDACTERATYYYSLYANMLRLCKQELAEAINAQGEPLPHKTQKVITQRKEANPDALHKFIRREMPHTFHLVTMNALVKKVPPKRIASAMTTTRGSWTERADPASLVWTKIDVGDYKRKLRDPRYFDYIISRGGDPYDPKFDGYEIDVAGSTRHVRITLEKVKHTITRIVAEKKSQ